MHKSTRIYAILSMLVIGCAVVLVLYSPSIFELILGPQNAILTLLLILCVGFVSLSFISKHHAPISNQKISWKEVVKWASLFSIVIISLDLIVVFPDDLNVDYPESLLYYGVLAVVAETIFHLVPISLLLVLLQVYGKSHLGSHYWKYFFLVAAIEPTYQWVQNSFVSYPLWVRYYVPMHIAAFNLCQLWLFKRFNFQTMLALRWVYYLIWHVIWGYWRIEALY